MVVVQNDDPDLGLLVHPNLQLVFNQVGSVRTALYSLIPVEHIGIIVNAYSNYVADGLVIGGSLTFLAYGTEDGSNFYGTEDGGSIYVPE